MRNSSTCFGRLTILRNAILKPLVFRQFGVEFGIILEIYSLESMLLLLNCQLLIASLKLFCNNKLPEWFRCKLLAFKCVDLILVFDIKLKAFSLLIVLTNSLVSLTLVEADTSSDLVMIPETMISTSGQCRRIDWLRVIILSATDLPSPLRKLFVPICRITARLEIR